MVSLRYRSVDELIGSYRIFKVKQKCYTYIVHYSNRSVNSATLLFQSIEQAYSNDDTDICITPVIVRPFCV